MEPQKTATPMAVFSEVLANAAFLFAEEGEAGLIPDDPWLETRIGYRGPFRGELKLLCPRAFATLLAANLLGIEAEDDDAKSKAEDAVGELLNIICGQFITTVYGSSAIFDLSIPITCKLDETPDLSGDDDSGTSTLTVQGHRVQLTHQSGGDAGGE